MSKQYALFQYEGMLPVSNRIHCTFGINTWDWLREWKYLQSFCWKLPKTNQCFPEWDTFGHKLQ